MAPRKTETNEKASAIRRLPRYPLVEFSRRGKAIYKERIEPLLKPGDKGKYVAIDIETGEYEIARDSMSATDKLYARLPDAQPWMERVGHSAVVRFGRHVRAATA